jgi:hypothetical protein
MKAKISAQLLSATICAGLFFICSAASATNYAPQAQTFIPSPSIAPRAQVLTPFAPQVAGPQTFIASPPTVQSTQTVAQPYVAQPAQAFIPQPPSVPQAPTAPTAATVDRAQWFYPQAQSADRAVYFYP